MEKTKNKYLAWKVNSKGDQISKDRILSGPSIKYIFSLLATEEGIDYNDQRILLRLPNGNTWHAHLI